MKTSNQQPATSSSFAIGIPTLNRMDLLAPALRIYLQDFPGINIFVFDNGHQPGKVDHPRIKYFYAADKNIGVAASWNLLCETIFAEHSHALVANDDVVMGYGPAQVQAAIQKHPGKLITTIVDWCVFILPKTLFQKIGPFDENFFPAYYEDKDYERRIRLAGGGIIKSPLLSPTVYRDNSTAEKDSSVHVAAHRNKEYFIKKWGGPSGGEKFSLPFNEKPNK